MNKFPLVLLMIFGLSALFFLNYNYPFFTKKIGRWSVGYSFVDAPLEKPEINQNDLISYAEVDELLNSEENYIADPFFIYADSTFYLFVELKGIGNADIALFTSKNGCDYTYNGVVLDEDFHLSYPQVFEYKDDYYMLPETKQSGNVLLYKAQNFPYNWQIEDTLIKNVHLKDPSLLLTSDLNLIVTVDDYMTQLFFTADSLKGNWKEAKNYIKNKGNETRPGGRFFRYESDWYLPVQDRSLGYGSGISLYKLNNSYGKLSLKLSEKRYLKEMTNIPWFNRGMHHFDIQKVDDSFYMVYDGDRNLVGNKSFQIKRSLKFIYYDLFY